MKSTIRNSIFLIFLILLRNFIKGKYREHLLQKRSAIDPSQYESDLWIKWCIENITESNVNVDNIKKALDMIEFMSCLVFIYKKNCPKNLNKQLLIFQDNTTNNVTSFEFDPEKTPISKPYEMKIEKECNKSPGCIVKKMLLYLGLILTHRRPDRDQYIQVNTSNVNTNFLGEFNTIEYAVYDDVKYDYGSIMHIRNSYMSNNSKFVFTIDQSGYESMVGQEYWLSFTDIKLLNKRYCDHHCNSVGNYNHISCKNGGILSSYSCNSCICPNMFASDMYCSDLEPSDSSCPKKLLNATNDEKTLIFESKYTCNVKIEASSGKRIKINILKARLPSHYPCFERLGLEIKYRKDKTVTGLCLCLLVEDIEIESEDEVVLIQYNGNLRGHMAYIIYHEI
uniref:Metalloendopeptidase n=1 Tax=Strongyloides papillosus TaxID=174720 RepID=A0A0N5B437_STREA